MRSTTGWADSKQNFGVMYTRRCTRTHRGRERESGGSRWLLELLRCQRWLAGLWVRAAVVGGALLLSSPGSRSRCQDGCSRQQTAFPLHLGSPRRKEIVLPHQCERCLLLPSRATVSCGSTEKPLLWLTSFSAPTKMWKPKHKRGRKKHKNGEQWRWFTVSSPIMMLT